MGDVTRMWGEGQETSQEELDDIARELNLAVERAIAMHCSGFALVTCKEQNGMTVPSIVAWYMDHNDVDSLILLGQLDDLKHRLLVRRNDAVDVRSYDTDPS